MTFTVLYFASAASYTNRNSEEFEEPSCSVSQFLTLLEKRYPGIKASVLDSCAVSVNLEYVDKDDDRDQVIKDGSEVAIIPPVSSG